MPQETIETPESNGKKSQNTRLPIQRHSFYVARQRYTDSEGRTNEVCAVLEITIPGIPVDTNTVETVEVLFKSQGAIREKARFSQGKMHLEMLEADLSYWQAGLANPATYLDIVNMGSGYIKTFLYAVKE